MILAISSAIIGTFTVLRKRSLVGDAVSHAVLPGVALGFILRGEKDPIILLVGAFITGYLSLLLIDLITKRTRIKEDTAIALVLSFFFGIGIMLLVHIQQMSNSGHGYRDFAGLNSFLFGSAASIGDQDIYMFSIILLVIVIVVRLFYKEFKLLSFDETFAQTIGINIKFIQFLMTSLTVLAVVAGIQSVGVVLMSAMLITPPAIGRFWTNNLQKMLFIAIFVSVLSSYVGAIVTTETGVPTGPFIVGLLTLLALLSFFFSPKRGLAFKVIQKRKHKIKMLEENILKTFYHLGEENHSFDLPYTKKDILQKREFHEQKLNYGLKLLKRHRYIKISGQELTLTKAGITKGQRITKIHRLWELYLTKYLRIAPDHVHEDAENIEHIITPELEEKLEKLLEYPETDPHSKEIPYRQKPKK